MESGLSGKKALIVGVANDRSLAWSAAQALHQQGAEIGFSVQDQRFKRRVDGLGQSINASFIEICDVQDDAQMDQLFEKVTATWGKLDLLIHSVAAAKQEELEGRFADTSREGFHFALGVSAFSLLALARRAIPLMELAGGGSVVTYTYHGSGMVVPGYHVMGIAKAALEASVVGLAQDLGAMKIRVNAISAGPIKTLSASGISRFQEKLDLFERYSPLRENITGVDVGALTAFLCSKSAQHITGSVYYVDSGVHILGA